MSNATHCVDKDFDDLRPPPATDTIALLCQLALQRNGEGGRGHPGDEGGESSSSPPILDPGSCRPIKDFDPILPGGYVAFPTIL